MTMVKMAMKLVSFVSGIYSVVITDVILPKYLCFLFNLHAWIIIPILLIRKLLFFNGSDAYQSWGPLYPV